MKLTFAYDKEKDVECLLRYGKKSLYASIAMQTPAYQKLIETCGDNPTKKETLAFVEKYLLDHHINPQEYVDTYQKEWNKVAPEFQKRAQKIFHTSLPNDVIAYLSVNQRTPIYIKDSYFLTLFPAYKMKKNIMHELWHFYTHYKFAELWKTKLGIQKYNDLKEALTCLLNVECKDLMGDRDSLGREIWDTGYSKHEKMREKILDLWSQNKDINYIWNSLVEGYK